MSNRPTHSTQYSSFPPYFSPSSIATFERCPRKYFFEKMMRLTKELLDDTVEPCALKFGSCMHAALPHAVDGDLDLAIATFKTDWGEGDGIYNDSKKNSIVAVRALADFFAKRGPNSTGPYRKLEQTGEVGQDFQGYDNKPVGSDLYETKFQIDVGATSPTGEPVPVIGKIDLPARSTATGGLVAVDFKTASQITGTLSKCFEINHQTHTYGLAMELLYGEECDGMIFDFIKTIKTAADTLAVQIPINRRNIQLEIWYYRDMAARLKGYLQDEFFPQSFSGCSGYANFGTQWGQCQFMQLCKMNDFMDGVDLYEQKPERSGQWDPTKTVSLTLDGKKV